MNQLTKILIIAIASIGIIVLATKYYTNVAFAELPKAWRNMAHGATTTSVELPDYIFRDILWHRCDLIRIGVPGAKVGPLDRVDSAWWTCKKLYDDMLQDKSCLVYGLGSGGDVSFDIHLAERGCEVHSFDIVVTPQMLFKNANATFTPVTEIPSFRSWKHKEWNWHYHVVGIGVSDNPTKNILSLPTIMKSLNHESSTIHYFKIDIEGPEYPLMKDIEAMADRIKTFAGEWHPQGFTTSEHRSVYSYLRKMESKGFRLIRRDFRYDFIATNRLSKGRDDDPIQSDLFFPMSVMGELYFVNIHYTDSL